MSRSRARYVPIERPAKGAKFVSGSSLSKFHLSYRNPARRCPILVLIYKRNNLVYLAKHILLEIICSHEKLMIIYWNSYCMNVHVFRGIILFYLFGILKF